MSEQTTEHLPPSVLVQLEIVSSDEHSTDLAVVSDVTRAIVDALQADGYDPRPVYAGEKGGALFDLVQQLAQNVQANQSFLTVLFGLATPIANYLLKERDRRAEKEKTQTPSQPITATIVVDGASITVETTDMASAVKLADRFRATHPQVAAKVTSQSKVKVICSVPPKSKRRRR